MPPLLFPLPLTSPLTFSSLLHDPSCSHSKSLAEATTTRTTLHLALTGFANGATGSSALAVVDAVQGYLPYLRGVISCLDSDLLLFKGESHFMWRAPLTAYTASPPMLSFPSIHCEYLLVMLTHVLALSNYAHSLLAALPTFEASSGSRSTMSSEDQKKTTVGLTRAVDILCQASGSAQWTAENVAPLVETARVGSGGKLGKNRWPVEASADSFRGLSMMLLADAHVTAIRKLLLPVLSHTLLSPPGPPLPSAHPSPALLAKLHVHVADLYTSAQARFKIHTPDPTTRRLFKSDRDITDNIDNDIVPLLKRYLTKESLVSSAIALKWLGVDAGELGHGARVGEAVAWMKESKQKLESLEDGAVREKMKGLGIGKANERKKEERKARKGRIETELDNVSAWMGAYSRINDTLSFQSVPPATSLLLPSGRPIFTAKQFEPPRSKFGAQQEDAHVDSDEMYAGKGTYF